MGTHSGRDAYSPRRVAGAWATTLHFHSGETLGQRSQSKRRRVTCMPSLMASRVNRSDWDWGGGGGGGQAGRRRKGGGAVLQRERASMGTNGRLQTADIQQTADGRRTWWLSVAGFGPWAMDRGPWPPWPLRRGLVIFVGSLPSRPSQHTQDHQHTRRRKLHALAPNPTQPNPVPAPQTPRPILTLIPRSCPLTTSSPKIPPQKGSLHAHHVCPDGVVTKLRLPAP